MAQLQQGYSGNLTSDGKPANAGNAATLASLSALGLTQPSVSKHLRVLRHVGLVEVRRDGKQIFYRTNAEGLRPLHEWTGQFQQYWRNQLNRIKQRAERN